MSHNKCAFLLICKFTVIFVFSVLYFSTWSESYYYYYYHYYHYHHYYCYFLHIIKLSHLKINMLENWKGVKVLQCWWIMKIGKIKMKGRPEKVPLSLSVVCCSGGLFNVWLLIGKILPSLFYFQETFLFICVVISCSSKYDIVVQDKEDKNYKIQLKMSNPMMQLRKIVNHPYLVHFPLVPGKKQLRIDEELIKKCGKLEVLDAMLQKLKQKQHKVND